MTKLNRSTHKPSPSIVMIHGWGQTKAAMEPLAGELAKNFRVINEDLPGHGLATDAPGPYTFARYVEWIRQIAAGQSGGAFHLLGWSMGGALAARYALERIKPEPQSLILICAPAQFIAPKGSGLGQNLSAVQRLSDQLRADHEAALRTFIEFFFMSGEKIDAALEPFIRSALTPPATFPPRREALIDTLKELMELDLTRHEGAPMALGGLIISGTLDRICPAAGQALWEGVLKNPRRIAMENCGHAPHLTRLEQTAMEITNFLSGSK